MLSLNLLPPSNLTLSKPSIRHRINGSLLDRNRAQSVRNPVHGLSPAAAAAAPICRIPESRSDFGRFPVLPLGNFSRFPSQKAGAAASGAPQESSQDGEIGAPKSGMNKKLAIVFGLWYFQNIVFNIYNKKVLNIFPYPWLLASFQLFCGSVWMLMLWSSKLQPCPKIDKSFIIALLGPALFHTVGHISACVSFSKVAVSFTHVIKSAEPVFTVIFSSLIGDSYPLKVWLSILPIVFGCSLAAVTEKSLHRFKEVNGLNLYGWITILSLFYLFPVAVFVEGSQWVAGYHKAVASVNPSTFYLWVLVSGIFYHLYNQSSYEALDDISPLTFSVGNTMKRVVVIIASVLVFRNPVRPLNALGSAIAIFGTFLYSQATAKKPKIEGAEKEE
ncbi:hypothetical protein SASPL_137398 [Salvia splendens]|uniref:Sugar phosphate transporter domain-containing protein n=1 Tax=Salvia splendens TaxID=180675 RepID=A0A8X8ZDF2_SALSN|nr:hypothetical protein SASPL_137398 [Salvia splendens]